MKNVLLTGCNSKISRSLIPKLVHADYSVTGLGRVDNGVNYGDSYRFVQQDLSQAFELERSYDCLIHLASHVPYNNSEDDVSISYSDILACNNLLKLCVSNNIKKVIYASSIDVYSDGNKIVNEKSEIYPSSYYGWSKISSEAILNVYKELYGIDYTVLRIGYIYGRGLSSDRFVKSVVDKAINGKDIYISNPDNILSLVYLEDLTNIIFKSMSGFSGTYNVVGNKISIIDFVTLVVKYFGSHSKIVLLNEERGGNNTVYTTIYESLLDELLLDNSLQQGLEDMKSEVLLS